MRRKDPWFLVSTLALILLLSLVSALVGCGSSGGGGIADIIKKLPKDAAGITFVDLAALRADDDLQDTYDEFRDQIKSDYGFLGISSSNVDRRIAGGSVTILEGDFDLEEVRDELKFNHEGGKYRGVETWLNTFADVEQIALVSRSCIVIGDDIDSLQGSIDVIKGDDDVSLSKDEDISDVADKLPSGLYVVVSAGPTNFKDCATIGISKEKKDSDTLRVTVVLLFENGDAAGNAKRDIERYYGDYLHYDNVEVDKDGRFIRVTAELDIDEITP